MLRKILLVVLVIFTFSFVVACSKGTGVLGGSELEGKWKSDGKCVFNDNCWIIFKGSEVRFYTKDKNGEIGNLMDKGKWEKDPNNGQYHFGVCRGTLPEPDVLDCNGFKYKRVK